MAALPTAGRRCLEAGESTSWRAGAGLPARPGATRASRPGWLPNGTYRLQQYNDYPGREIHGRALRLDDKACPSGTVRRDLFVHTEQAAGTGSAGTGEGDQACRWEYPRFNDYKSFGCIKMSPADLASLVRLYHQHFGAAVTQDADAHQLAGGVARSLLTRMEGLRRLPVTSRAVAMAAASAGALGGLKVD